MKTSGEKLAKVQHDRSVIMTHACGRIGSGSNGSTTYVFRVYQKTYKDGRDKLFQTTNGPYLVKKFQPETIFI